MEDPMGGSSENVSTLDDVESISLPSLPDSVDSVDGPGGAGDGSQSHRVYRSISERRLGRKMPALNGIEITKAGRTLQKAKITDGPTIYQKPKIVEHTDGGAAKGRVRVPVVRVEEVVVVSEGDTERPSEVAPRVRRVSDVIDSLGSSTPNSPRTPAPPNGQSGVLTTSPVSNSNENAKPSPTQTRKRISDRTDSAPMGKHDDLDASPITAEEDEERHVCATVPVEKDSDEYNMNHRRRGHAIILNHYEFDSGFEPRKGSDVDAKVLEQTLDALGFTVLIRDNLEYSQIKELVQKLKAQDHSDADCLVFAVLSHGMHGGYILAKDVPYSVDFLWQSFKADVCPTLAGKPKMFFIQACRGEKMDRGVHMMRSPARTEVDSSPCEYKIPSYADFLVAFSTVEGHYAWRNPEKGTWFIQCLCKELSENGTRLSLQSIMTRTSRRVALDYQSYNDLAVWNSEMKQVPQVVTMLIREVYFRPKCSRNGLDSNALENNVMET